jgi:hypothetical protein
MRFAHNCACANKGIRIMTERENHSSAGRIYSKLDFLET